MNQEKVKIRVGNRKKPVTLIYANGRIYFKFGFWKALIDEIRQMEGRKWHGFDEKNPMKAWSIPITPRNMFQLEYLKGGNPYSLYDGPLKLDFDSGRPLYNHQREMTGHVLAHKRCIIAGEMGVGKTLSAIVAIEEIFDYKIIENAEDLIWWVGPKSALVGVHYEFIKWKAKVKPRFITYNKLVSLVKNWPSGKKSPRVVVFDESSKIKTPTAQRSQAALHLADAIRDDWGDEGYIIEMSGSPAPKSPADWWHQCEVACPGFLVEGNIHVFKQRLGIIHEKENPVTGGKYPHLVAWRDNPDRCDECGELRSAEIHSDNLVEGWHDFKPSKNEVSLLYDRMKGLVLVRLKKDCLDLPEKQYREIELPPSDSIIRTAKLIAKVSPTAIQALTRLRELSDGFQYIDAVVGKETCSVCHGTGEEEIYLDAENITNDSKIETAKVKCTKCNGSGQQDQIRRETKEVECPKEQELKRILEEYEDVGRLVIYAGFTGSIDRICRICREVRWAFIRVDGRGWYTENTDGEAFNYDTIPVFQDMQKEFEKVAFIGHPGSAGMGLTLTASPTIVYYSNDFSAESRIQSEDRIHRPGMDTNRGATIIDLIHLETDRTVLNNLRTKRELQALTLGELQRAFDSDNKT